MDSDTQGKIVLALIMLGQSIFSSWDKKKKAEENLQQVKLIAAEIMAEMTAQTAKLDTKLEVNTAISIEAKEGAQKALTAVNKVNQKWEFLTSSDADELLIGKEEKIMHDMQKKASQ